MSYASLKDVLDVGLQEGQSVVVVGPALSGKTAAVYDMAEQMQRHVVELEPLDIFGVKLQNDSRTLGLPTTELGMDKPSGVVLIKHIDVLLQDTELHRTMHDFLRNGIPSGWVLAATARSLFDIPEFLLSHFTHAVEQGLPSYGDRERFIREAASGLNICEETILWLVGRMGGLGFADLKVYIPQLLKEGDGARERYNQISTTAVSFRMRTADVTIPTIRWGDILGHTETIETLRTSLSLYQLESSQRTALGLSPCNGVLLYGLPGNGKTLLAKAVATEMGATFLLGSVASLVKGYVGESERMVRELFAKARQNAPCCVFLDEVQAVFGDREDEGSSSGGHDGRVVSQLLAELESLPEGVFVLAATNTPEVLDASLLAPGRLDLHIHVPPPSPKERLAYLQKYCSSAPEELVVAVAEHRTNCYTYSDLASLVNVAKLRGSLDYAASNCQASFTPDMLAKLQKWK